MPYYLSILFFCASACTEAFSPVVNDVLAVFELFAVSEVKTLLSNCRNSPQVYRWRLATLR